MTTSQVREALLLWPHRGQEDTINFLAPEQHFCFEMWENYWLFETENAPLSSRQGDYQEYLKGPTSSWGLLTWEDESAERSNGIGYVDHSVLSPPPTTFHLLKMSEICIMRSSPLTNEAVSCQGRGWGRQFCPFSISTSVPACIKGQAKLPLGGLSAPAGSGGAAPSSLHRKVREGRFQTQVPPRPSSFTCSWTQTSKGMRGI